MVTRKASITREAANHDQIVAYEDRGPITFGPWTSNIWRSDPRHLAYLLSRYKFAAKMLSGRQHILEAGCGDAVGVPILLQEVTALHAVDAEPLVLHDAESRFHDEGITACTFELVDLTKRPPTGSFDGALSVDVIEHVPIDQEAAFMRHIVSSLEPQSVCIIGTPNATAAQYASKASQEAHINLKHASELRDLLDRYFHNVFIFSMNDEVVHTGYSAMAHYLFGVGVSVR